MDEDGEEEIDIQEGDSGDDGRDELEKKYYDEAGNFQWNAESSEDENAAKKRKKKKKAKQDMYDDEDESEIEDSAGDISDSEEYSDAMSGVWSDIEDPENPETVKKQTT